MYVVATAGHVDHGKSTLVRALTGIEPDRWDEEKRRGLTIDLGFAWTTTPSGRSVAFVDVPGHERFLGNMLAGIGPVPVVCFVVAADEGWRQQSGDHRDAVEALGIEHGVIVISRTDLAPDRVPAVIEQVRAELADTGLRDAPVVPVSAVTGDGLPELMQTLDRALDAVPKPLETGRVRLWIDRSFAIRGAGTVVTGTLSAGTLTVGDRLSLLGAGGEREVSIRGLQQHGGAVQSMTPVSRVAINLRGVDATSIHRGDTLLTPAGWQVTSTVDVRTISGAALTEIPEQVAVHLGTLAVPGRLRPFGEQSARVTLAHPVPVTLGDRIILQDNGTHRILAGVQVVDADPPSLRRRGDGARRAQQLSTATSRGDLRAEVARRGAVRCEQLTRLGFDLPGEVPEQVRVVDEWWIDVPTLTRWAAALKAAIDAELTRNPLSAGLSRGAAASALKLPDPVLLAVVVREAGAVAQDGVLALPRGDSGLGPAEAAVSALEGRLRSAPFAAPEADELTALELGQRELAAAERVGRLLRLSDGVVLLPSAPALAMRELASLPGEFTTSQAREALGTTRRVAIPLLEHLDARGWTRRVDATHRVVRRATRAPG